MKCTVLWAVLGAVFSHASKVDITNPNPLEKVVELLETLKEQMRLDQLAEQKTYDRTACWCTETTEKKAKDITTAQAKARSLGQSILSYKGSVATLKSEIEELNEDINDNKEATKEATGVRQKQNSAWQSETAEMKQTLKALNMGIDVLTEATKTGSSFLQSDMKAKAQMAVGHVLASLPEMSTVSAEKVSLLSAFTSDEYSPQSTQLQGILADMYSTFATDLEKSMHEEAQQNKDFEKLMKDKDEQLKSFQSQKSSKAKQKSEEEEILADMSENYDNVKASMEADMEFFDKASKSCKAKSEEWTERSQLRTEEKEGVQKALEILSSDDARNLFKSAIKPGKETGGSSSAKDEYSYDANFLQVSEEDSSPAARAYAILKKHAKHSQNLELAQLAVQIRMAGDGHFTPVMNAISVMMETLVNETRDDTEKRDQCKAEFAKLNTTKADLQWKIEKAEAGIAKFESLKEARTKEKDATNAAIQSAEKEIKDMEDQRQEERESFAESSREDREAIRLLIAARDSMSKFYKKNKIDLGKVQGSVKDVFLQTNQDPDFKLGETQEPEFKLSDAGNRKLQSKGVISIITMIVEDLGDEVSNAIVANRKAEKDFEENLHAAKKMKKELEGKKDMLLEKIAKRQQQMTETADEKRNHFDDLNDELAYEKDITPDCSWILKEFYNRKEAREAELEGLRQAKDVLATSNQDNGGTVPIIGTMFLQKRK